MREKDVRERDVREREIDLPYVDGVESWIIAIHIKCTTPNSLQL